MDMAKWIKFAFTIAVFAIGSGLHKAAIAESTDVVAAAHDASTDGRGNPADWNIATNVLSRETMNPFPPGETKLTIGDRLKVSVYERIGSATDASSTPLLSTLAEHPEVSGEYTIQTDGTIDLPFIGHLEAAGKTRDTLQQELEGRVSAIFKGRSTTTVRLTQREPIYVTGTVRQPGTFKYTPGMTVLNAVILAGNSLNEKDTWQHLDLMRIVERLQQNDTKLATLLAQRDVLIAMRDGSKPTASSALSNLVGRARAAELIVTASVLEDLKVKKYKNEQQALVKDGQMLEKEKITLTENLNDAQAALEHAKSRMSDMTNLHKTGVTTDSSYYQAIGELEVATSRWDDLKAALVKLERNLVAVSERQKGLVVEEAIAREQAITDLEASIVAAEITRTTLRPALTFDPASSPQAEKPQYMIMRATNSGIKSIKADRFSYLQPGDIVEVIQNTHPLFDVGADFRK